MDNLYQLLAQHYDEMVEIRRHLHENPELSHEEVETPKYIAAYHHTLGHEVREFVGGRGVIAKLHGAKPGKTVALRADFDALAIHEQNTFSYKSKIDGKMHACGHDGHTATLLVLAKVLNKLREQIAGTIVFIHQFGEEVTPGGALPMIEDGCLDGVDVIYGTHLSAGVPLGTISVKEGHLMAAADGFEITIHGKGGHGASPHDTKDAVMIGSQFVVSAQQVVGRRVNPVRPAVVSVCHFEAVNPFNVIADSAVLKGTVRTFDAEVRDQIEKELEEVVKSACLLYGADYTYTYNRGYSSVINDAETTRHFMEEVTNVPKVEKLVVADLAMGGEDFAYYLEKVPGTFYFTGAKNPEWEIAYPHHHPKFDIDERALLIAANTLGHATLSYLQQS
ncbi:amidohydrolase [Metasolibacillus meyeri]|uniref:amidohydrolase n=1 Tax=Metasolibacillus meyeri TaxID=1071052 RepID=UPI000D2FDEB2|nr:amidohydrolase [Metasolibacillus meyeri]